MSGSGRPMPCIPVGVASNTSPVRFVASPRTYESPRVAKVLLPQSSQVSQLELWAGAVVGHDLSWISTIFIFTMSYQGP